MAFFRSLWGSPPSQEAALFTLSLEKWDSELVKSFHDLKAYSKLEAVTLYVSYATTTT